ncbi:hypothetical protein KAR91_21960 [Candidatus Pacearchaeota archaeon]|nr:hypothetical protein [Candidatus Pacearchaeota archaeon]
MIKLMVKHPGLFIDIPGIPTFRSPAEIDITKQDVTMIIAWLRQAGIDDYEIISGIINPSKPEAPKKVEPKKVQVKELPHPSEARLDKIEKLLVEVLEKNSQVVVQEQPKPKKKKIGGKKKKDKEFIPSINVNSLKSEGNFSTKTSSRGDIDNSVDLLSKIKK